MKRAVRCQFTGGEGCPFGLWQVETVEIARGGRVVEVMRGRCTDISQQTRCGNEYNQAVSEGEINFRARPRMSDATTALGVASRGKGRGGS